MPPEAPIAAPPDPEILECIARAEEKAGGDAAAFIKYLNECYAAKGSATRPIGLKRPLARQLRTSYSPRISDRTARRTFRALVVGDPDDSLSYARKEATEVHDLLKKRIENVDVELRLGAPDELGLGQVPGIKPADLFEVIALLLEGTFDFVHFAGHAVFDPDRPDRSGWLFAGGQVLTPSKLANITDVPRLIFANACLSGGLSRLKATAPKGRRSRRGTPPDVAMRRAAAQGDSRLVASLADELPPRRRRLHRHGLGGSRRTGRTVRGDLLRDAAREPVLAGAARHGDAGGEGGAAKVTGRLATRAAVHMGGLPALRRSDAVTLGLRSRDAHGQTPCDVRSQSSSSLARVHRRSRHPVCRRAATQD
jgi:CHAT domain